MTKKKGTQEAIQALSASKVGEGLTSATPNSVPRFDFSISACFVQIAGF